MHKTIDFSILRLINRHLNYLLFRFLSLGCQSNLNQQCVDYNNCVILRMFAFIPQVKKLLRRWQLCIELTLGTTCRCFLAQICSNICCQQAIHTREGIQKMKRGEKTATLNLCPWILKTPLHYTMAAGVPGWQQFLTVWTCLSAFFSSWRWLTTLTTHSALFQHIMKWLMCVDEQRMLCGAMCQSCSNELSQERGSSLPPISILLFWL